MTATLTAEELAQVSASLAGAPAEEILRWAESVGGERTVVTSSFSDAVLVHLVHRVTPGLRVVFIDTGFHFPETLSYVRRISDRYRLHLEVITSGLDPTESPCGSADCCQRRKVEPLRSALAGQVAWVSGIRREETPERADSPVVSFDDRYEVIKVNPLAEWSFEDVLTYVSRFDLPVHPLMHEGYLSVGCAPVTSPVDDPGDPRSGRWPGSDKTECGLHL